MRRAGRLGILDEPRFLLRPKCLSDLRAGLELYDPLLSQPNAQYIPRQIHDAEEEADFLVDRFRCGLLTEAGFLVSLHLLLIDIDKHFVAEHTRDVAQGILRKCGARVAKFIADKVFVSHILDGPRALLANILEIVETLFKFTAALLLSRFGERF